MNVLVVIAHPNPQSFNMALLESVKSGLGEAGHTVRVKDLYSLGIKTNLDGADLGRIVRGDIPEDIKKEQEDLLWAEGLVFIYPIWWFAAPSILKGWVDRVFLRGFAYDFTADGIKGLLKHEKALLMSTTGGDEKSYSAPGAVEMISKPMDDGVLRFCGVREVGHKFFFGVVTAPEDARKAMLKEAKEIAKAF